MRDAIAEVLGVGADEAGRLVALQALVEQGCDADFWLAPDGRLLWTNAAAERVTGYTPDEWLAMAEFPGQFPLEEDRAKIADLYREALSGSIANDVAFRARRKDGAVRWMAASWRPVFGPEGRPLGVRTSLRDVSERKEAEEREATLRREIGRLDRLKTVGTVASGLAHEINQPLTAVVLQAEAVSVATRSGHAQTPEEFVESLEFIVEQAHRAGHVVQHLRQLVRETAPRRATLSLRGLVDDILPLLTWELRGWGVALTLDVAPSLPAVSGDRPQLQQVLLNLAENAIEAMADTDPNDRSLTIEARRRRDDVEVSVRDRGCGLPDVGPRFIETLFGPFYSTKPRGIGLGLPISRSIVEAHGGRIRVRPNLDRGVTFSFTVPIARREKDRASRLKAPRPRRGPIK